MKKMNKLLAVLLAASMAVTAAPMALADEANDDVIDAIVNAEDESFEAAIEAFNAEEEAPEYEYNDFALMADSTDTDGTGLSIDTDYDQVKMFNKFESETNTNSGDGTKYKVVDSNNYTAWNGINFNSNYYASLDFMFTDDTKHMELRNKTSGGNYGSHFKVSGGKLVNDTGSASDIYANFATNKWYKLSLEGRMRVTGSYTTLKLYEYNANGTLNTTPVATVEKLGLRNFAGSNDCKFLLVYEGVCIDNEYAVQEWPDSVVISDGGSAVNAGDFLQFSAQAQRNTSAENLTQPKINWTVEGIKTGEENYFSIDSGKLTVTAKASTQTVTVKATADSNGNPYATQQVAVTGIDLNAEPFDDITVDGDSTVQAGSTGAYTFTAKKNDVDVTSSLTDSQYKWEVYNSTGTRLLGNKYITIENGTLTVGAGVVAQTISVRASTSSGAVYGEKQVTITNNSPETVVNYNACEEKITDDMATVTGGSWDGSSYYINNTNGDYLGSGTLGTGATSGDILISMDIKFMADGAGFTTCRRDGGAGLWLRRNGGKLAVQTGGSSYNKMSYDLDTDAWYHIDLMYSTTNPSINIYKYDENGNKTNKGTFTKADKFVCRSEANSFNRLTMCDDTGIDNYFLVYPNPTDLKVTDSEGAEISSAVAVEAGIPKTFGVSASRDGLPITYFTAGSADWDVCETDNDYPVASTDFSIKAGVLSTNGLTVPQTVRVRAAKGDVKAYATVNVTAANQFEITGIQYDGGTLNKDTGTEVPASAKTPQANENHLVRLLVNKIGEYKDDVVFIMRLFDKDDKLVGSYSKKANAKNMTVGENAVTIDYNLPEAFINAKGKIKVLAWTALTTLQEPSDAAGRTFAASYADGTVNLTNVPAITGKTAVAVYKGGIKDSQLTGDTSDKIVYAAQSDAAVSSVATGTLEAGTYIIAVGGIVDGSYAVYRAEFTVGS